MKFLYIGFITVLLGACGGSGSTNANENPREERPPESVTTTPDGDESITGLPTYSPHWAQVGVFSSAAECGACHSATDIGVTPAVMRTSAQNETLPNPNGKDISPYSGWQASVMAQSFTDPYFRATMKHEVEHFPHIAGFIEDTCLKCHTPMGRTHAHQTVTNLEQDSCGLPDGCYRAETAMQQSHAREGVSCTLCHQISDTVLGGTINSGNYEIANVDNPTIFGPFQNPVGQSMLNRTGYTPAFGSQTQSSALCASCHTLFTPTVAIDTDLPNGANFPEQTPYDEWQHSDYATGASAETQCQGCHMGLANNNYETQIATHPDGSPNPNWPTRSPYYSHDMLGGNTWILNVFETFREELGLSQAVASGLFRDKENDTRSFLQTAAELQAKNIAISNNTLNFEIQVFNRSGHKFPTSFPARRAWLATQVTDANGKVIFESGIPDAKGWIEPDAHFTSEECMSLHVDDDDESESCFAHHVNTVTDSHDIPIYESVLGATDGHITHVLLYAAEYLKDNRIPPQGFDNASAVDYIKPIGVSHDPDFNNAADGSDTVHYQLPLPSSVKLPLSVRVTLYYQSVRPTFVKAPQGEHQWIEDFQQIAALVPPQPEVVTAVQFSQ